MGRHQIISLRIWCLLEPERTQSLEKEKESWGTVGTTRNRDEGLKGPAGVVRNLSSVTKCTSMIRKLFDLRITQTLREYRHETRPAPMMPRHLPLLMKMPRT
jgi:hypothetical protein